jgi:methenyltetrahydrofolate cyclohydrolase
MGYIDSPVKKYLDDLSAKLPAPGGGSAAAMASSLGIALLSMVANFTIGKKGYEKYDEEVKEILNKIKDAQQQMQKLVDEDVRAYTVLSEAYKLPKNTEQEIKQRNENIQKSLKNSLSVPCKIFEVSVNMFPLASRLLEIGNKNLLSDVACGVSILKSGIETAKFNIDINLKYLEDEKLKSESNTKYSKEMKIAFNEADKIIKKYGGN